VWPAATGSGPKRPVVCKRFDSTVISNIGDYVVALEYKDWTAIHDREFAKMESLDVYAKRKEERRRRLQTPVKRAAAFAAKLVSSEQQQQLDTAKVYTKDLSSSSLIINNKIIIIIIIRQFIRRRNVSESLQGRLTMSKPTRGLLTVTTLYDKEIRRVLSRFLNVDDVCAFRMSRGKLLHAVGPAMENARLRSWRGVD